MAKNRLNIILGVDVTQLTKGLRSAENKLNRFSKNIGAVGRSLTQNLTVPIAILAGTSVKTFADFELSLAKVKAVSGATGKSFDDLKASALELGRTTQFTASQVAGLQLNLSKLGFSPEEIEQSTSAILDLALATGEDLAESAGIAASTLRGFGLDATETIRVTNVMADSFSSTSLDLEKFGLAMSYVAPVANQAGASIEQTTALLGTLTDRGLDASSAGAALRNIFLDIADKGLSLNEAMDMVKNSTNPLATAMELFGKRGATVATIIAENRDEITELTADFIDSEKEARKMAEIMENTLSGSFELLKSAVEGAGISIGEILAPFVRQATQYLNDMVTAFNALNPETKKSIVRFALIAAAIGPVLLAISAVAKVAATLSGALKVATLAMSNFTLATLANPAVLAFAATVGVLYLAFQKLRKEVELGTSAQRAATDIQQSATKLADDETRKIKTLVGIIESETTSREGKIAAVKELKRLQPEYFSELDNEGTKIDILRQGYDKLRNSIFLRAKATAAVDKINEIARKEIDLQQKLQKVREEASKQSFSGAASPFQYAGQQGLAEENVTSRLSQINEELQSIQKEKNAVADIFSNAQIELDKLQGGVEKTKTKIIADLDIPKGDPLPDDKKEKEKDFILSTPKIDFGDVELLNVEETSLALTKASKPLADYAAGLAKATEEAQLFGASSGDILQEKLNYTKQTIQSLLEEGYTPQSAAVQTLLADYQAYSAQLALADEEQNKFAATLNYISNTVGSVLSGAFDGFFDTIANGGKNAFKSFADGAKQAILGLVKQLIVAVAKAAALALIFTIISGGSAAGLAKIKGFLKLDSAKSLFGGLFSTGLATGGIIPPGYPNDTFPARLSSGEAVIPLDKLNQYTGGNGGTLEARISGEDLLILMNRTEQKFNRFS